MHEAACAPSVAADPAATEEGPAADDLRQRLAEAQARLAETAEEAADLRNRLTALAEVEALQDAAQAQVRV